MRYSGEHKQQTRERVVREAAREIRAKGPAGVAVAGVMARAGLTHGGFYAHFASRDALIEEAIDAMFADARRMNGAMVDRATSPNEALRLYVENYLSPRHRDGRERGCPLPSLSADLARLEPASRERFGKGVAGLTERVTAMLTAIGVASPEAQAASMLAEMVGALALSRAVADSDQSDAILTRSREAILARFDLEEVA